VAETGTSAPLAEQLEEQSSLQGSIVFRGEAFGVYLVNGDGKFQPAGVLPAGSYTVMAVFPGKTEPVVAADVQLRADQHITLDCSATFQKCQ